MTNKLEKQFFDTFGIEQQEHKECKCDYLNCPNPDIEECEECYYYKTYKFDYPAITDRILLELICILSQHFSWEEGNWFIERTTIDELKEWLLEVFIEIDKIGLSKIIKHQVQSLFEEG